MSGRTLEEFWPFDRRGTQAVVAFSAILFAFIFVIWLKAIFTPFFVSLMLAYVFNPIVNLGERFRISRWLSTILIFAIFSLLLFFISLVIAPSVYGEMRRMLADFEMTKPTSAEIIQKFRIGTQDYLPDQVVEWGEEMLRESIANFQEYTRRFMSDLLTFMKQNVFPGIAAFFQIVITLLLMIFYFFFLLTSLNRIWDFIRNFIIPYDHREIFDRLSLKIHESLSAFFRGRLIVCVIISLLAWSGLAFLEVPFAFLFGFGIGFATIVPLMGLFFLAPAMLFFLLDGASINSLIVLLCFYGIVQLLEMFILTPVIIGREVELPWVVLILSFVIFYNLFGVIGVLLAVPIATTTKILFYEFIFPSFLALSKRSAGDPPTLQ